MLMHTPQLRRSNTDIPSGDLDLTPLLIRFTLGVCCSINLQFPFLFDIPLQILGVLLSSFTSATTDT